MSKPLESMKIAVLMTDGTDKTEFTVTRDALVAAGAKVTVVSPKEHWVSGVADKTRLMDFPGWGVDVSVDAPLEDAQASQYDGLFIPGGVVGPDLLRLQAKAGSFVAAFFDQDKPIASLCHGPTLFVDADRARGRRMTSWSSVRRDLENAGAQWEDSAVVVDRRLVTSRSPADLEGFTKAILEVFGSSRSR